MSEQQKKQQRIYDFLNAETKPKNYRNNLTFLWSPSSPDLNPFDCAIWGILEEEKKKTNATSHANIGSLKTAIEEEWNKISEEFILRTCKSFRGCVDKIIEKNGDTIE